MAVCTTIKEPPCRAIQGSCHSEALCGSLWELVCVCAPACVLGVPLGGRGVQHTQGGGGVREPGHLIPAARVQCAQNTVGRNQLAAWEATPALDPVRRGAGAGAAPLCCFPPITSSSALSLFLGTDPHPHLDTPRPAVS